MDDIHNLLSPSIQPPPLVIKLQSLFLKILSRLSTVCLSVKVNEVLSFFEHPCFGFSEGHEVSIRVNGFVLMTSKSVFILRNIVTHDVGPIVSKNVLDRNRNFKCDSY